MGTSEMATMWQHVDQQVGTGQLWVVVGGGRNGGIMVRSGQSLSSRPLQCRLSLGTQIEEVDLIGNRLHYKRVKGDGPDSGWVSIDCNGKSLVEPSPLKTGDSIAREVRNTEPHESLQ